MLKLHMCCTCTAPLAVQLAGGCGQVDGPLGLLMVLLWLLLCGLGWSCIGLHSGTVCKGWQLLPGPSCCCHGVCCC